MITTVTTSTVTTVTALTQMGLTTIIGIFAVASLITFLVTKEISAVAGSSANVWMPRFVNVGVVPLTFAFIVIAVVKILEVIA